MRFDKAIYVARIGETDVAKVGCTRCVSARLLGLTVTLRSSVTLLACWQGSYIEEQRIHRALSPAAIKPRGKNLVELYWRDHPEFQRFLASIPEALRVDITQVRGSRVRDHDHCARFHRVDLDMWGEREASHRGDRIRMERLGLVYRDRAAFNPFPLTPTPPLHTPTTGAS